MIDSIYIDSVTGERKINQLPELLEYKFSTDISEEDKKHGVVAIMSSLWRGVIGANDRKLVRIDGIKFIYEGSLELLFKDDYLEAKVALPLEAYTKIDRCQIPKVRHYAHIYYEEYFVKNNPDILDDLPF